MFTGTMIDDLVAAVKKAEANVETEWRMKEELQNVPAFMLQHVEMVNSRRAVHLGVA